MSVNPTNDSEHQHYVESLIKGKGKGTDQPPQDRRRYPRFKLTECTLLCYKNTPLHVYLFKRNIAKKIFNLGKGGVCFTSGRLLSVRSRLYFKFHLPKFSDNFEVLGKVCWSRPIPDSLEGLFGKGYFAGCEFTSISARDGKKLELIHNWFTSPEYKLKQTRAENTVQGWLASFQDKRKDKQNWVD